MSQIVVSPNDIRRFTKELSEITSHIKSRNAKLDISLKELGSSWEDEKYKVFSKTCIEISTQLQGFYRTSDKFIGFLTSKAAAADRYLKR